MIDKKFKKMQILNDPLSYQLLSVAQEEVLQKVDMKKFFQTQT